MIEFISLVASPLRLASEQIAANEHHELAPRASISVLSLTNVLESADRVTAV